MNLFIRILRLSLVFILIFQSVIVSGQENEFVIGKLVDSKNRTPIPFATLRIKYNEKGLISNADGGFKIPYKLQRIGDTLVISSIGYLTKEILLSNLDRKNINLIQLSEKIETLNEVTLIASKKVKKASAKKIVRTAMEKISENYPFAPFSYVGYYRDYQIKEGKYLNLNEAIMEVFDSGFSIEDLKGTKTRIFQYKKNPHFPTDTIASKPYDYLNKSKMIYNATLASQGGNEFTILRLHDAIRNYNINTYDFVNRFDIDLIKNHKLKLLPETFINDVPLYHIKISKIQNSYRVTGKIYISKDNFQIYKLAYAVYDKRKAKRYRKKLHQDSNRSRIEEKKFGEPLYEIIVEYQYHEEKMYPSYVSFKNSFEILQPAKFIPVKAKINHDRKRFELIFNNTPLARDAVKKSNYNLWYQEVKLRIDSIAVKKNNVLLYPENKKAVFNAKKIRLLRLTNSKGVAIEVKNVRDIYGNVVYEQAFVPYNQYREFFVQQIQTKSAMPSDTLYMLKKKPIFENQPIVTPKNLSDYWMNTPLKN